jgi:hypothetical protein
MDGQLQVPAFIKAEFQTEYLPEPYLVFGTNENLLYVLTTNPGKGMQHQDRSIILSKKSIISPNSACCPPVFLTGSRSGYFVMEGERSPG